MIKSPSWFDAPLRDVVLAPPAVIAERREDGTLLLRSPRPMLTPERSLCVYLQRWAERAPERLFLCERDAGTGQGRDWRHLSYEQAYANARCVAQGLIDRGLDAARPVLILTESSLEHAVMVLGCYLAGVPVAPISPAYAQVEDLGKLRLVAELLNPALVFAQSGPSLARALSALGHFATEPFEVVTADPAGTWPGATALTALLAIQPTEAVDRRTNAVGPDTVAKFLFTSGSTGTPKAVPNTHRMLCANQAMLAGIVPPDPERPPVFVDWLPWSHTFGGNVTFNWILRDGGTLYLDHGKPVAQAFAETLENLRSVSPTHYFNVPAGYAMLVDALEREPLLRERFFRDLQLCYYGGSGLPQSTFDRLEELSVRTTGRRFVFTTGCGSTETGPIATFLHWPVDRAGVIGLPVPGVELKLVPDEGRYEMRMRGTSIFDGYFGHTAATAAAFDEEGYYRTGDAVRPLDSDDLSKGLVYEGRTVEDFKLATGTFVNVGLIRLAILSAMPLLREAVLAAPDRPWLGMLAWISEERCRALLGENADPADDLLAHPQVRTAIAAQLQRYNEGAGGSSRRVRVVRLLRDPPSMAAGEVTEKGYVNQRAVLKNRSKDVALLYINGSAPSGIAQADGAPTIRSASSA